MVVWVPGAADPPGASAVGVCDFGCVADADAAGAAAVEVTILPGPDKVNTPWVIVILITRVPVLGVPVVESVAVTVNEVCGITGAAAVIDMTPVAGSIAR